MLFTVFNEEEEVAQAYDTAAKRYHGIDALMNFTLLADEFEAAFLSSHSKAEIVDMLQKHTYHDELEQSRWNNSAVEAATGNGSGSSTATAMAREQLFEKAVTLSNVGNLNRPMILKQYANKHFPLQSDSNVKGILLNFEDSSSEVWRF